MTYPMPTDTAHVRIESRQYRLLNIDLGEGVPRSSLKVGALILAPWVALMWLLGVPVLPAPWLFCWALPPLLLIGRCVRRDHSGRVGLAGLLDAVAFRTQRHRHRILNAETARPDAGEVLTAEFLILEPPSVLERGSAAA